MKKVENLPKYVKDILDITNKGIYNWIKQILKLNLGRSLEIFTSLLNDSIFSLYFPFYSSAINNFREEDDETPDELLNQERINEIICSLFLYISLKFDQEKTLSHIKTDIYIEIIKSVVSPLISNFYLLNVFPLDFKLKDIKELRELFKIEYRFLPDLDFDPEFQKILDSDPIQHLFYLLNPQVLLEKGYISKYRPDKSEWIETNKEMFNPSQNPLNINPALEISDDLRISKAFGLLIFPTKKLIDEIIELFIKYYSKRFPLKAGSIRDVLLCYGVLLKKTYKKGYIKIQFSSLKKAIAIRVGEKAAEEFLNKYTMNNQHIKFKDTSKSFDYKKLIQEYQEFLKYTGYVSLGMVHTAVFLVWRSLLKYLESLQQDPNFKFLRGELLEIWAYNHAVKNGFKAEKLIITNANRKNPSKYYLKMKEQTKNFPKVPLELNIPFSEEKNNHFYMEFDVTFRVKNHLFAIECKGTSIPKSQWPQVYLWFNNLNKEFRNSRDKINHLLKLIKLGRIKHPFLKGVDSIVDCHLKTEGLLHKKGIIFSMETYKDYLKNLKEHLDNGNFDEFKRKRFRYMNFDN